MIHALVMKELRETAWIWLLAAVWFTQLALDAMMIPLLPFDLILWGPRSENIPFLDSRIAVGIGQAMGLLGIALAMRQSVGELHTGTVPLTLHLPVPRRAIFGVKIAVALGLIWGLGGVSLIAMCVWASSPGTHASPFEWAMTITAWQTWFAMPIIYLGALTTGLLAARWYGTRLFPLVSACVVTALLLVLLASSVFASIPLIVAAVLTMAAYAIVIGHLVLVRDFS